MTAVNAFNWKEFTEEERVKRGDPFAQLDVRAAISKRTTKSVDKLRKTNPTHGTIYGVASKHLNPGPVPMMKRGTGVQLHSNKGIK